MTNLSDHIRTLRAVGHAIDDQAASRMPKEDRQPAPEESLVRTILIDLGAAFLNAAADLEQQDLVRLDTIGPLRYPERN